MRFAVAGILVLALLAGACSGEPPTPTPTPAPTSTPVPTATPTPEPTPTPESTPVPEADSIALEWAAGNPDVVISLVVDAVMASPETNEKVPAIVRVGMAGLLHKTIGDELGSSLSVEVGEVAYLGDALFSVTLLVAGSLAVEIGPVEALDLSVPLIVAVDVGEEKASDWAVDLDVAEVSLR